MESFDTTDVADLGGSGLMQTKSHVSRRTVVATGVAAAWSIPLIQLATAAPALAVSGKPIPAHLTVTGTGAWAGKSANMNAGFAVTNDGGTDTGAVTVVVTFAFPEGWAPQVSSGFTGWTVGGSGSRSITFTKATSLVAGGTTGSVSGVLKATKTDNQGKAVDIGLLVNAGTIASTGGTISVSQGKA